MASIEIIFTNERERRYAEVTRNEDYSDNHVIFQIEEEGYVLAAGISPSALVSVREEASKVLGKFLDKLIDGLQDGIWAKDSERKEKADLRGRDRKPLGPCL